ncbi:tetratricopeptide repeat-containing sulfotransferase family protein [Novosphingobium mangrovi (ex Hu et al. 2023)]|uniref:Sulfotransferase n=1 Tax=Novosphingobium mangrovi (ex Hu et al. 2023) TaxID=2930094 RepID=A0ABT0AHK6_9SPHN|nr:tetratricopeptide repeat-containing sulfotransferase family protein [Novosphingobium mangrovi (ex Hu et al. 2023)]MCJ1962674.1 sulfotransferase [Novosphingobium mangrovi (ex Hu et al. 2023)]
MASRDPNPAPSSPDEAALLKEAREAMQRGQFAPALGVLAPLLDAEEPSTEGLYMAAVACRYLKRFADAESYLSALSAAQPEYGRAWQEAGHLARDRGDVPGALRAYARATRYNPVLDASWRAQADLLARTGRQAEAAQARTQAERIAALPRELLAVSNHLHEGRLLRAEEICRAYLQTHRTDIEGMRLLAEIASRLGILDDAEFLLESAVTFSPDTVQLRLDYIQVLRKRQKFAQALEQAEALHTRDPESPVFASHLAIEAMQTGDYARAFALFDAVLEKLPQDPATLTSKGHALKTTGAQDEAVASYRAAIAAKPEHGDAWYALANLKTWRFSADERARMEDLLAQPDLAFMDRVHLTFAAAKAAEDEGLHAQAFAHYTHGNELKLRQSRYDADRMHAEIAAQIETCTPELFARQGGKGHPAPDPIFILGLPRAGSTLLEQILASHPMIDGTLELPDILATAHRLRGRKASAPRYPQILHELSAEQLEGLGKSYIENTRIHRQSAPLFIDKMPNNFRHIGLIHLILPNAKIIDARREAMDCCFSGFKQLFAEGQEFTYGLTEIGRYYRDYVALMEHWDRVLPGRVLRVQHEDVLDDLEGQVRRMLDYIGVPFDPACLDFHKTDRAVRTASSEQVRRPISRSGVGAWKPYEEWLGPLRSALEG